MTEEKEIKYAGFWIRVLAVIIDSIIIGIVFYPILHAMFPTRTIMMSEFDSSYVNDPASGVRSVVLMIYSILMLHYYDATIGKRMLGLKVTSVDGKKPAVLDIVIRETIGKFLSAIVFGIGFITVGVDPKKQGWHDKLAKTVVVYEKK